MKIQNYNYPLFEKILEAVVASPEQFSMTDYFAENGQKCILGWAIEISGVDCDRTTLSPEDERSNSDSMLNTGKDVLGLSMSEAVSLVTFLGDVEYEDYLTQEEIDEHAINLLELIVEKRNLTIHEIIDAYLDVNRLNLLQLIAAS